MATTVTAIALVSYIAMASVIGGGLGTLAIRFGTATGRIDLLTSVNCALLGCMGRG
ncbi:hypothetical protein [Pseudomonas oryzihabitans]|uniref:hypothetical protein n=1 Tax=Pseudomonas oryzihabitans TaxID=47885 RepID=UPI0039173317